MAGERFALLKIRVRLVRQIDRLGAVHMRHHLSQVSHVDQRAADGTVPEVLQLGPLGVLTVGAGVAWDVRHQKLSATLKAAWDANCYKVMLATGSPKPETLRFYESAGFERGGKTFFQARRP